MNVDLIRRKVLGFCEKIHQEDASRITVVRKSSSGDIYLSCSDDLSILKLESPGSFPPEDFLCFKVGGKSFIALPEIKRSFLQLGLTFDEEKR